jgi:hypothetical protein
MSTLADFMRDPFRTSMACPHRPRDHERMTYHVRKAIFHIGSPRSARSFRARPATTAARCACVITVDEIADNGALAMGNAPQTTSAARCCACPAVAATTWRVHSWMPTWAAVRRTRVLTGRDTGEHGIQLTVGTATQQSMIRWNDGTIMIAGIPGQATHRAPRTRCA